jgi:hypothetical protein
MFGYPQEVRRRGLDRVTGQNRGRFIAGCRGIRGLAAAIVAEFAASVPPEECPFAENMPDWRTWWRRRGRSWDELGYYLTDQDRADRLRQLKT